MFGAAYWCKRHWTLHALFPNKGMVIVWVFFEILSSWIFIWTMTVLKGPQCALVYIRLSVWQYPGPVCLRPMSMESTSQALNWATSFELAHVFWDLSVLTLLGRAVASILQSSSIDIGINRWCTPHQPSDSDLDYCCLWPCTSTLTILLKQHKTNQILPSLRPMHAWCSFTWPKPFSPMLTCSSAAAAGSGSNANTCAAPSPAAYNTVGPILQAWKPRFKWQKNTLLQLPPYSDMLIFFLFKRRPAER